MKETFRSMIDQADPNQLEPFFENLKDEAIPKDAVSRIQSKVLGRDASGKAGSSVRRWIPALSAAACLILAAGIFVWSGLAGRKTPAVPPEGTGVFSEEAGGSSEEDPVSPGESGDVFLSEPLPADGPASGLSAASEPAIHFGIRFYVLDGAAYMFYEGGKPVYRYENGSFARTRVYPDEQQFSSTGTYGRYAYVGGMFHCCGNETGLFRVDLNTGRIEKIVDSAETVTSVVTDGAKIYYSTYTGYDVPTSWKYSLKCADLEKKEITEILSDVDYPISSLKMSEGNLFFNSYGRGGIRCLFPDGTLRSVSTDSCSEYAVDRDTVYTFSLSTDGTDFVYKVCACNLQGERIGFSETRESAEESGNHTRRKRRYVGSGRDGITVFDGRVVFFDDQGVWLEDLADGSTEKILDDPFGFEDPYRYEFVSKAVFDGKLFLCWSDENWTDRLIIYDSGEVRQMTLG